MSVKETGIGFRLGTPTSAFTTAGMQGAGDSSTYISSNATSVLSSWSTYGRTASVIDYWGAGAPAGITRSRYVVYHYRGFLSSTSNRSWIHTYDKSASFWLSFSGKGYIKVVVGGSTVLNTKLESKSFASTSLLSSAEGTQVDIYYWQLGEAWGGLVGKYVPQISGQGSSPTVITTAQLREAPVISASIIPYTTASTVTLPQVLDASVEISNPSDIQTASFTVALKDAQATYGWSLLETPRRLQYVGPGGSPTYTLKRRNLIEVYGGFQNEQYQRFSGYIEDIDENDGKVNVRCLAHTAKLSKIHVENYPDKISYSAYSFFKDSSTNEPVYNITAYDAWPLEYAIEDLCLRGGIDPKLFHIIRQTNNVNGTITDIDDEVKNKHYYLRAKAIDGGLIYLQKPRKYGNAGAGFSAEKPSDDTYSYKPELSRSILDFCKELADSLGYDFRTNSLGAVVLASRNNPHRYTKVSVAGGTVVVHPSAIAGYYKEFTGSYNSSNTVNMSRVDLVVGRKDTLGVVNYSVHIMSGAQVASGTINLALTGETNGIHYYDNRFTLTGANQCAFTLYTGKWGKYEVKLSRNAGTNWIDSLLLYDYDAQKTPLPEVLLTTKTLENLRTSSRATEISNHVVVIGRRKSTLTDSAKTSQNINNPETEYFVAAGTDPSSIWDPSSSNYSGGKISSLIIDSKISDQDYANWVAQTLLTRQRDPAPATEITVPCLPSIEPRDPIQVSDEAYDSVTSSSLQWVIGVRESYSLTSMQMNVSTTAYPEIASYEPRQDISIATIDSTYGGQPVINVNIVYPSIDSGTITNIGDNMTNASLWGNPAGSSSYLTTRHGQLLGVSSDGNGKFVTFDAGAWPPIPDSIAFATDLYPYEHGIAKNSPYFKFWHIYDYSTRKVHIPCLTGDGTTMYGNNVPGAQRDAGQWGFSDFSIRANWQGLNAVTLYSGVAPFYDPYTSELPDGALINITMDMLISGYYRISVWDARDRNNPTIVAWLTEPGQEDVEEEKHWTYFTAGKAKQFLWDAVDNVGEWNQKQSKDYSWKARGWFEKDQHPAIGKGFYAWNDQSTPIVAISGQTTSSKLTFNPDHFAQFYIKVEVTNDKLVDYASTNGTASIRTVNSYDLKNAPTQNPKSAVFIYTHLPPPNKIILKTIEDWSPAVKTYDHSTDAYGTTGWVTTGGDSAASFTNSKPIRITFEAVARPGTRFGGNKLHTNVKVHRVVHMGYYLMDQFLTYMGETWHQNTTIEKKRLTSRRLWGTDVPTLDFADTDFRTGDTLDVSTNKWVFRPQDFTVEKNGVTESLDYCNYLQLEDVPDYSVNRGAGEKRSRFIIAYMGYVFYFSAYVQDRSGRMTWAIDNTFVDKAKILQNTFTTDFPEDLENYSTRTIVARQWVDTQYRTDLISKWNITGTNPTNYVQFYHYRLEPHDNDAAEPLRIDANGANITGFLTTGFTDDYSADQQLEGNQTHPSDLPDSYLTNRQLGRWTGGVITHFLGDWTWEGSAADMPSVNHELLWIPDLTRDFHPYHLVPPMPMPNDTALNRHVNTIQLYAYMGPTAKWGMNAGLADLAAYQVWHSKSWAPSNSQKINDNDMWFVAPLVWEHDMNANTTTYHYWLNYTRQDDIMHWEEFRGTSCAGAQPDRQSILVQPTGGAYLVNPFRYANLRRWGIDQNVGQDDSTVIRYGDSEYSCRILTRGTGSAADVSRRGLFSFRFRSKYNWHSSSFFPTDEALRMLPRFLYPKYTISSVGAPVYYDAGAWTGWKDDLPAGSNLNWDDNLCVVPAGIVGSGTTSFYPYPWNIFDPHRSPYDNQNSVNLRGGYRIRTRPAMAIGPVLSESKELIVSLSLVNSRRSAPIPGK